jgi:hypothetical protein
MYQVDAPDICSSGIQILSRYPKGMRMKDPAGAFKQNRNAVVKYLGFLHPQPRLCSVIS